MENKPGANAAIGIDALMRSNPDGHTLAILSDSPVTINVHLLRLNYDPLADLVPISGRWWQPDHPERQCQGGESPRLRILSRPRKARP